MDIERKARESLDAVTNSSIEKIVGIEPARSREVLTYVFKEMTTEFSNVCRDAAGSKRLYDVVSQSSATPVAQRLQTEKDHVAVLGTASTHLKIIIGDVSHQRMQKKLAEEHNLSATQADNSLALASLSVLDTLKQAVKSGAGENNSAGIKTLLTQDSAKVLTVASGNTHQSVARDKAVTSTEPIGMVDGIAVAGVGSASLTRFVPHLLLGLLALGAVKYCSDAENHRVVEEERVSLQDELSAARMDAEASTSSINALQSEFDSAQAQIESLKSDLDLTKSELQTTTAELLAERDVPNDMAELQMLLSNATKERNVAVESNQTLNKQIESVTGKYNATSVEVESTKAELEAARSIIASTKGAAAEIRQLKVNISGIRQKHDAALQRNASIIAENKTLRATIEDSAPTITDLESQVMDLQTNNSALVQEQKLSQEEISHLMSKMGELEQRHQSAGPRINKLESKIASLHHEIATVEAKLQIKSAALEEEQNARRASTNRLTTNNRDVQNQLSRMTLLKDAAESRFRQEQSKVSEQAESISDLRDEISVLETANKKSEVSAVALQKKIDELDAELANVDERMAANDLKLTEKDDALAAANDEIAAARLKIAELQSADGNSDVLRDELQSMLAALNAEKDDILKENTSLSGRLLTLDSELKAGIQRAENAERSIEALEMSLETERKSLKQVSKERDQVKESIVLANADIDVLTAEKTDALKTIDGLNRQISVLDGVVVTGRATISDLKKNNRQIEKQNIELQQGEDATREKVVSLNTRLDALSSALDQERENASSQATKNTELEKRLDGVMQARDRALEEVGRLQQALTSADRKVAALIDKQGALIAKTKNSNTEAEEATSETLTLRSSIEQQLTEANLESVNVQSIENDRAVAITLGSKSLYRTGDASLTREGGRTLNKIGKILENYPDWRIDIEGHTDSLPIGVKLRQRYPSNWELSSARASAVVTFLRLTTNVKTEALSAKGYAETQPIADNTSAEGREQNRRVDIVLRK